MFVLSQVWSVNKRVRTARPGRQNSPTPARPPPPRPSTPGTTTSTRKATTTSTTMKNTTSLPTCPPTPTCRIRSANDEFYSRRRKRTSWSDGSDSRGTCLPRRGNTWRVWSAWRRRRSRSGSRTIGTKRSERCKKKERMRWVSVALARHDAWPYPS